MFPKKKVFAWQYCSLVQHKETSYVILCNLYLKSILKIVHNKKLINIDWLTLHLLQETKCDALLLLLLLQPTQTKFKQQQPQQQQKQHSSSMRKAPKRVDCISVIYDTFLYTYMPHTYAKVHWDITISYQFALIRYTRHFE